MTPLARVGGVRSQVECPWAINFAAVQPGGSCLTAAVGDAPEARLLDWRTGKKVADLVGHFDYSFAAAWHPEGNLLATGNQVRSSGCCYTQDVQLSIVDTSFDQAPCLGLHRLLHCNQGPVPEVKRIWEHVTKQASQLPS